MDKKHYHSLPSEEWESIKFLLEKLKKENAELVQQKRPTIIISCQKFPYKDWWIELFNVEISENYDPTNIQVSEIIERVRDELCSAFSSHNKEVQRLAEYNQHYEERERKLAAKENKIKWLQESAYTGIYNAIQKLSRCGQLIFWHKLKQREKAYLKIHKDVQDRNKTRTTP